MLPNPQVPNSKPKSHRLTALDGLRGISSLLVLAQHIKLDTPQLTSNISPLPLKILVRTLLNSGNISVGFFFILCGFLMAYLYENPPNYIQFVQKRYLRIFSILIVAVVISFSVLYLGVQSIGLLLVTLLLVPVAFRLGYTALFRLLRNRFVFWFFIFFIGSQALVAFANYFIVFRMGAQEFFRLPHAVYTSFMFATNYTLTFIFGDYIPMIDGGYWSLVSEVMFYLAYPLIAWVLIAPLKKLSKYYWIAWYVASMIAAYGLSVLFRNLLAFDTAHIHFAHFFTVGMMIALAYKEKNALLLRIIRFLETPLGHVAGIVAYVLPVTSAFWLGQISSPYTPYLVTFGLAPLMGLAVIATIAQKSWLARLFNARIFLFLGAISYPLYVIHSPIVNVMWKTMGVESNTAMWAPYVLMTVILALSAAYYLHVVVEKFYFVVTKQMKREDTVVLRVHQISTKALILGSMVVCIIAIFVAFQKDFGLLSVVQKHDRASLALSQPNTVDVSLLQTSILRGEFRAKLDNLGIVTMRIVYAGTIDQDRRTQEAKNTSSLIFRIREKGAETWLHESTHSAWKMGSDKPYPFGFPEVANSQEKWYEFQLENRGATPHDYVIVPSVYEHFHSVYKVTKDIIRTNPLAIAHLLLNKISGAFLQREALLILGIYASMLGFVIVIRKKSKPH
ncbi:acyltransferase [Candidatus Woesebacteria bacterium]|nr:acyltransferase [Candidatus Woesebacteria bacterium]